MNSFILILLIKYVRKYDGINHNELVHSQILIIRCHVIKTQQFSVQIRIVLDENLFPS